MVDKNKKFKCLTFSDDIILCIIEKYLLDEKSFIDDLNKSGINMSGCIFEVEKPKVTMENIRYMFSNTSRGYIISYLAAKHFFRIISEHQDGLLDLFWKDKFKNIA